MGSAVCMGRRNLFAGRLNGSRTAQIWPESPGRQRPTTETADAACEEVIETPGASPKPGCLLRRPMRTADPIGPFRKNQNYIKWLDEWVARADSDKCCFWRICKQKAQ